MRVRTGESKDEEEDCDSRYGHEEQQFVDLHVLIVDRLSLVAQGEALTVEAIVFAVVLRIGGHLTFCDQKI